MGRKRLPEEEKKVDIKLRIKKKYLDQLREKEINISKMVEDFIKDFLNSK